MKSVFAILFSLMLPVLCDAQDKLIKDLDGDGTKDTVFVDAESSVIVCRLSSQKFRRMESQPFEILNETSGITEAKEGFTFFNDWMRAGYKNQFRYNPALRKMQLIGMSRYEFGNAANDGSGESSVNLLTNSYIGNWNYRDEEANVLVKIPTIKVPMKFETVLLEQFGEETYFKYAEKCADLYAKHKIQAQKRQK